MLIVALMGRSGSGKSATEAKLSITGFNRIVSYTTRKIRSGEENHREYHFVTDQQFDGLISKGILVEWAEYNNHRYGAPKPVGGDNFVVVLETDGFKKFKQLYGSQVVGVYINTDIGEINNRLEHRGNTDSSEIIKRVSVDNEKFNNMDEVADLVVDGNQTTTKIVSDILRYIVARGLM